MDNKYIEGLYQKMGISELNEMQQSAYSAIQEHPETILISPTGTGKTIAFLLPIIAQLDADIEGTQVLILAPSRELAIQIEHVCRSLGSGHKVNAVYGGRSISKDFEELNHPPTIWIGTPGRVADHLRRGTLSTYHINTIVLDEFDKSLEVGFEKEMKEIIAELPFLNRKVLTSATQQVQIPSFINLSQPKTLSYINEGNGSLEVKLIPSPSKDKLETLSALIKHIGDAHGIIFCNYKDTINYVSEHLKNVGLEHVVYYGGLEQRERERALIQFRNGTYKILLSTDLAARGIDVPKLDYIIHYQLPFKKEEFIHRNGRTARMHENGTAYVVKWSEESSPDFIRDIPIETISEAPLPPRSATTTLFISGGRKDKISKGDIVGMLIKKGNLDMSEVGMIELKQDCSFVAVPKKKAYNLIQKLNNSRLKKRKVRIYQLT